MAKIRREIERFQGSMKTLVWSKAEKIDNTNILGCYVFLVLTFQLPHKTAEGLRLEGTSGDSTSSFAQSRVSYTQLTRSMSSQLLSTFKDEDSTTLLSGQPFPVLNL